MHKALLLLTNRLVIAAMNVLLIVLMLQGSLEVLSNFQLISEMQDGMEEILEGLGTILVALGVALEERETLMKFLDLYPRALTPVQARVDHHCHGYGLLLLLVGLFVEVAVYVIRMPNLKTVDFDPALIITATVLCLLGGALMARLTWLLCRASSEPATI